MTKFILCIFSTLMMIGCSSFHYVKTGDPQVELEQIVAAGESEDSELAPGLQKLLQNRISSPQTFDSEKTIESIIAVGKLAPSSAQQELITLLKDEDEEVRFHAVEVLGNVRESAVVRALVSSTKDDDELVADAASRSLSKLTLIPIHDESGENQKNWEEWWQFNAKYFTQE
ncbi:HEAT repeat domain-containing protein [Candidatus Uabimicrobium amorphum]|uniref:HEAT repeat domain-containing protein n=1 Tax=Uabimicrobium amorphum TaxID=2596890 RepID=A0A5S9IHK6_UABAM|nr:HEAT repeat domain-containing protein [Candidatus Uabimicrobium amorphum]BBM81913.1 hypothetical protein UABAM_00255 [Candidatus Uabimicrobium amorphum]